MVVRWGKTANAWMRSLQRDRLLRERIERLMTIPGVGPVTAPDGGPEGGGLGRFSSIQKAIRDCGRCGAENRSADTIQRPPLSQQRNKHLQAILIEAAKM